MGTHVGTDSKDGCVSLHCARNFVSVVHVSSGGGGGGAVKSSYEKCRFTRFIFIGIATVLYNYCVPFYYISTLGLHMHVALPTRPCGLYPSCNQKTAQAWE